MSDSSNLGLIRTDEWTRTSTPSKHFDSMVQDAEYNWRYNRPKLHGNWSGMTWYPRNLAHRQVAEAHNMRESMFNLTR